MVQLGSAFHVGRHDLFEKMISSKQFAFTIGSSAAKQPRSLCRSHRLLGIKDAMYHATVLRKNSSLSRMFLQRSNLQTFTPTWSWKIYRGLTGVLAAIFETLHGEMEFVFGKGQSMPKSWSQSIAIRIHNMFPFWIGPLECRIASLLHFISLHGTGITRHQKYLASNTSQTMIMLEQRRI